MNWRLILVGAFLLAMLLWGTHLTIHSAPKGQQEVNDPQVTCRDNPPPGQQGLIGNPKQGCDDVVWDWDKPAH
ncbi:MAG: hypothetical protein K8L91_02920 [Anaerolineae bacterium]|nr:hypothetical protein [Anaerolineae bacterium]